MGSHGDFKEECSFLVECLALLAVGAVCWYGLWVCFTE
jgi:hypothetical protein